MNNAFVDFKREETSKGTFVQLDEAPEPSYHETELEKDLATNIKRIIAKKEKQARDILHLYFEKEYRPKEIRQVLNIPYNTISSVIYRFKLEMSQEFGRVVV